MPMYSFKCPNCSLRFEKAMKSNFDGQVNCPTCSGLSAKLPPQNVMGRVSEITSLPKEIDLKVGADSDKKWVEYEDRKSQKEKIRKETESDWISRDLDGEYTPLTVGKDNAIASKEEAVTIRKEMWKHIKDPDVEKTGEDKAVLDNSFGTPPESI